MSNYWVGECWGNVTQGTRKGKSNCRKKCRGTNSENVGTFYEKKKNSDVSILGNAYY